MVEGSAVGCTKNAPSVLISTIQRKIRTCEITYARTYVSVVPILVLCRQWHHVSYVCWYIVSCYSSLLPFVQLIFCTVSNAAVYFYQSLLRLFQLNSMR
jgi:hypothetical protein